MTKDKFLLHYRDELEKRYPWAQDKARLDRFMQSVTDTLSGQNTWNHDGEAVTRAWHIIGGKGKPTKKALRELA